MESSRADEVARPVARARRVRRPDPRAVLDALDAPRVVWSAPGEPTVVAAGATATITAEGPDRFERVRAEATDWFEHLDADGPDVARPRLFGGFAFHDDGAETAPWTGFPGARFVLPSLQVTMDDAGNRDGGVDVAGNGHDDPSTRDADAWLTVTAADPETAERRLTEAADLLSTLPDPGPVASPPGVRDRRRTTTREDWADSVEDAVARIRAGDLRKVVLAQALDVDLAGDLSVADCLTRLGDTYPECHRFLVEPGSGGSFFGATPERLVSLTGRTVETGALAGTTGRGDTEAEDEWLAAELLADEKNRHEHDLVAEAVREQLAPVADAVDAGETTVRKLATVQHLWTPITAALDGDHHVLDLVAALHPTPAVGGVPPDAALSTIREAERFDRGWYAAPVGWFDADGDGTFAVALRSAVARDRTATLFAGVGIVGDSNPAAEWDEVELKFRPVLDELEAE